MRRYLAHSQHDPDKYNCFIDLPEDIQNLYRQAKGLEHLCRKLDDQKCRPARSSASSSSEDEANVPTQHRWEEYIPLPEYPKLLSKLKTVATSEGDGQCHICKGDMTTTHCPTITRCSHVFGRECLERAVTLQAKCPMCREEIPNIGHLLHSQFERVSILDNGVHPAGYPLTWEVYYHVE